MSNQNTEKSRESSPGKPSLVQVFGSVLASMFGVQSGRKHAQDFAKGKPWVYVAVGLVVTIAFVMTVWFVVRMVLRSAGV